MTVPGYADDVKVPDEHEGEGEDKGEGGRDEGVQGNLFWTYLAMLTMYRFQTSMRVKGRTRAREVWMRVYSKVECGNLF